MHQPEKINNLINFLESPTFKKLDTETRLIVHQNDKEFDEHVENSANQYLKACRALQRIQEALRYKHPGFADYITHKPGLSNHNAYRMIAIAEKFDSLSSINASKMAFYILASAPEEISQEMLDEAIAISETGREVSRADALGIRKTAEDHRRVPAQAKREPVYKTGDRAYTNFHPFKKLMIVRLIQEAGQTFQYEVQYFDENDQLGQYDAVLETNLTSVPPEEVEEEYQKTIEPKVQKVEEHNTDLVVMTLDERLKASTKEAEDNQRGWDHSDSLLDELFQNCQKLPTEQKQMVFANDLDQRIEAWFC